ARQRASNDLYDEFCARLIQQPNVATWLRKRGRTPEIALLHRGHDIDMSISFRLPTEDEPVLLAWDLRAVSGREWPHDTPDPAGVKRFRTDKALRTGDYNMGTSAGGSWFRAESYPIETAYEVYRRAR